MNSINCYLLVATLFTGAKPASQPDMAGRYLFTPHMSGEGLTDSVNNLKLILYKNHTWGFEGTELLPSMTWKAEPGWVFFKFPKSIASAIGGPVTTKGPLRAGKPGFLIRISRVKDNGKVIDFPVYLKLDQKWYPRYFVKMGGSH